MIHKRYMDGSKYVGFLTLFGTRVWSESLCVLLYKPLYINTQSYMPQVSEPSGMIKVFGRFLQNCRSNFSTNQKASKYVQIQRQTDTPINMESHSSRGTGG